MTVRSRNRLIAFSIIAAPFIFLLCLMLFWDAEPLPPLPTLPHPNGYDDLVKAGQMTTAEPGNYDENDEPQVRAFVATNAEALVVAHASFSNECRVPLQFSTNYFSVHLEELAGLKRLAQAFTADGRLAEMENRTNDAIKAYLDTVHLGVESGHGGVLIDELVAIAIEAIGTSHLQTLIDQMDAKTCRETAATLESLYSQSQSWGEVMQQESDWSRRTFPGIRNELARLMERKTLDEEFQKAERKFDDQQNNIRQLIIALATRAYQLDKGKPPENPAALVPDYLKVLPALPDTATNLN